MKNQKIYLLSYITEDGYDGGTSEFHIFTSFDKKKLEDLIPIFESSKKIFNDEGQILKENYLKILNPDNLNMKEWMKTSAFTEYKDNVNISIENLRKKLFKPEFEFISSFPNGSETQFFQVTELSVI